METNKIRTLLFVRFLFILVNHFVEVKSTCTLQSIFVKTNIFFCKHFFFILAYCIRWKVRIIFQNEHSP